jgi:tetratricopeptide (TPR) repeat protein
LLPTSQESVVLITSRVRLFDLDGAHVVPLDLLSVQDSQGLLARMIGKERVAAEPDAATKLIELCGQLPLALRICAGRLVNHRHRSLEDMAQTLGDETRRLRELSGGGWGVAASIRLSYLALEHEMQTAFRRLGVFPGQSLDVHVAAVLFETNLEDARDLLDGLLDVHLLDHQADDRYVLHDLVRCYARSLAEADDEQAASARATERLLCFFHQAVTSASALLYQSKPVLPHENSRQQDFPRYFADADAALAWLHQEHNTVLAAVHMARVHGLHRHAAVLPHHLGEYLQTYGYHQEAWEIAEQGFAAARELGDTSLMRISATTLAVALWNLSCYQDGLAMAEHALELARELDDQATVAACLSHIGSFHNQLGNFVEGLRYLEQTQEFHRQQGALRELADIAISISAATGYLGQYEFSAASARKALKLCRHLGEPQGEALALLNVANAEVGLGRTQQALTHLEQAWRLAKARQARTCMAKVLVRLTRVYLLLDRHDAAQSCAAEIHELLVSSITPNLSVQLKTTVGLVSHASGDLTQARVVLEHALDHADELDLPLGQAESLQALARVAAAEGEAEEAVQYRKRADVLFDAMGIPVGHVRNE